MASPVRAGALRATRATEVNTQKRIPEGIGERARASVDVVKLDMRRWSSPPCSCGHSRNLHCREPLPEPAWCHDIGPCGGCDPCQGYKVEDFYNRLLAALQK